MSLTGKFDAHNRRKIGKTDSQPNEAAFERFKHASNARNVCFVQQNGRRLFLNYAYLISGEYVPESNIITLTFTTHIVILKGNLLEQVYESLLFHLPKLIQAEFKRYESISSNAAVHEIIIQSTKI